MPAVARKAIPIFPALQDVHCKNKYSRESNIFADQLYTVHLITRAVNKLF